MSTQIGCDQCGQTAVSNEADQWYQIMQRSLDSDLFVDLCTLACVVLWGIEKQKKKVLAK